MSFSVPTFDLVCDIYSGPWLSKSLRLPGHPCNLACGKRVQQQFLDSPFIGGSGAASLVMGLLLPALTDLHDEYQGFPPDVIECPAGSGRWYQLQAFDDVGKGFPNEYRLGLVVKIGQTVDPVQFVGLFWPTPVP